MAVDIKAVAKNPKLLIVVGVGVIGGVILITKLKPKESSTPVEVTPEIRTNVVSADDLQREDENSRLLADLQRQKAELEEKAQQDANAYNTRLNQLEGTLSTERDQFNTRLSQLGTTLGNQYQGLIQGLEAQIKALQDRIAQQQAQPLITAPPSGSPFSGTPNTNPAPNTPPTQPAQPSTGQPGPLTPFQQGGSNPSNGEKLSYPGLGMNYQMNCNGKPRALIYNTFDELVADQRKKGLSSTSLARNCAAIAISGSTKWEVLGYDKLDNELWRGWVNQTRVAWGLYPLTYDEMGRMQYLMRAAWPEIPNESATSFQSLTYARRIWEQYNRPYQCGTGTIRR